VFVGIRTTYDRFDMFFQGRVAWGAEHLRAGGQEYLNNRRMGMLTATPINQRARVIREKTQKRLGVFYRTEASQLDVPVCGPRHGHRSNS
jgi:hypothetical protein